MPHKHQSWIGLIREYWHTYRREQRWSNETMGQVTVDAHECLDGPATTGITFDPSTQDVFTRQRINGERICRWLDDDSKSNNLLPANFIPSVLASLPITHRAALAEALLRPLGLGVRVLNQGDPLQFDVLSTLSTVIQEAAGAQKSLVALADGATAEELQIAAREIRESIDAQQGALKQVEAQLQSADVLQLDQYVGRKA